MEKAKELVDRYAMYLRAGLMHDEDANEDAKQCALIAVDFAMNSKYIVMPMNGGWVHGSHYYKQLKQEIEKL